MSAPLGPTQPEPADSSSASSSPLPTLGSLPSKPPNVTGSESHPKSIKTQPQNGDKGLARTSSRSVPFSGTPKPLNINRQGVAQAVKAGTGSVQASAPSQGQSSDHGATNRLDTLEKQRAADFASLQRLSFNQSEMTQKLDKLQVGMDTLALQCSQAEKGNNETCADELATINVRLDSIVSRMEDKETVCPRPCNCEPTHQNQRQDLSTRSAAAPAAAQQPSRSPMAIKNDAAPAGGDNEVGPSWRTGYDPDDATRRRLELSDDSSSSAPDLPPDRPGQQRPQVSWKSNTPGRGQPSTRVQPLGRSAQPKSLDTLVMVSECPVDYDPEVTVETREPIAGRYCPGIGEPKRANDIHFRDVCDYRNYRLDNTDPRLSDYETRNLTRLRKDLDNAHRISKFSGEPPIQLLSFLRQYTNATRDRGHGEALAARLLPNYLEGEAANVVEGKIDAWDMTFRPYHGTWPSLVQALIMRFLKDEVLKKAMQEITSAKQKGDESEGQFSSRLSTLVAKAGHVFTDREKTQLLLDGVPEAVGQVVRGQLKLRPPKDIEDYELVEELVTQEGLAHRARIEQMRVAFRTPKGTKLMLVNEHEETVMTVSAHRDPSAGPGRLVPHSYGTHERPRIGPSAPSVLATPAGDRQGRSFLSPDEELRPPSTGNWRPMNVDSNTRINDEETGLSYTLSDACDVAETLDTVLTVAGVPTMETSSMASSSEESWEAQQIRDITTLPIPKLSPREIEQAMQVIPDEYWDLNCWVCRTDGHSMYKCPLLLPAQRLYFAYRYYLYQIQANPRMKDFLADRMRMRRERRHQRLSDQQSHDDGQRYQARNSQPSRSNDSSYRGDGHQRRNNYRDDRGQGGNRVPHKTWARENSPVQGRRPNVRFNSHDRVHAITPESGEPGSETRAVTVLRRPADGEATHPSAQPMADNTSTSSEENG